MRQVLVIDERRILKEDMQTQMIVDGIEDDYRVTVMQPQPLDAIRSEISSKTYDFILVEETAAGKMEQARFGVLKVYGYCMNSETPSNLDEKKIPFMGQAENSEEIIRIMEDVYNGKVPEKVPNASEKPSAEPEKADAVPDEDVNAEEAPVTKEKVTQEAPRQAVPAEPVQEVQRPTMRTSRPVPNAEPVVPSRKPQPNVPRNPRGDIIEDARKRQEAEEYARIYEERRKEQSRTKTISVYSAKGGVGKTTIATNLALYLSMIPHGKGTYKVCLVDYNIESGDVRSLLGFKRNEKTVDMGYWAEDIHNQLIRGRRPEDIQFTTQQIHNYLTDYNDRTGLSVLLAPAEHENAQYIETQEIEIMLRNVIDNGGFDYVICDTADNTSDGSVCALENSDLVLMVCTQDATAANRNASVLASLKRSHMDLTKFRLVINNATSRHKAGVSIREVLNYFDEYECVGKIKEDPHVKLANNFSKPIVNNPRRQFRKDLQSIVQYIIRDDTNTGRDEKKKKTGILG